MLWKAATFIHLIHQETHFQSRGSGEKSSTRQVRVHEAGIVRADHHVQRDGKLGYYAKECEASEDDLKSKGNASRHGRLTTSEEGSETCTITRFPWTTVRKYQCYIRSSSPISGRSKTPDSRGYRESLYAMILGRLGQESHDELKRSTKYDRFSHKLKRSGKYDRFNQ